MAKNNQDMEQQLLTAAMNDPKMQQVAMNEVKKNMTQERGKEALVLAGTYGKKGVDAFKAYVQAGPGGIQVLCFMCGCCTTVVGAFNLLSFFNLIFAPFDFILSLYCFIFGVITICVEADPDTMEQIPIMNFMAPKVLNAQQWLNVNAKFLTLLGGRGLFYIMIGLVMIAQCLVCPFAIAGFTNIGLGVLSLLMYLGYKPDLDLNFGASPSQYRNAVDVFEARKDTLGSKALKEMDALKRQVDEGDLDPSQPDQKRPGMFDVTAKAQWEARKKLVGVSKEEAMDLFVNYAKKEGLLEA